MVGRQPDKQGCLDAAFIPEIEGVLVFSLDLIKALFDHGLVRARLKYLRWRQAAIIGYQ